MSLLAIRLIRRSAKKRLHGYLESEDFMTTTPKGKTAPKDLKTVMTEPDAPAVESVMADAPLPVDWAEMPRQAKAEAIVKDHMLVSLGVGFIPFPLVDIAAAISSQIVMVKRLCTQYDVPFSKAAARSAIMAVSSAVSATGAAVVVGFSFGKLIPGLGTAAGMVALPIANAAMTYTIGKLFIGHFEMGGTLFDFDPKSNKDYVRSLYARGKSTATDLSQKVTWTRSSSDETAQAAAEVARKADTAPPAPDATPA